MKFRRTWDERTGEETLKVPLSGSELLQNPLFNKGLGFTEEERRELKLEGLLPPRVVTLEQDVALAYEQYQQASTDVGRYVFLARLQNRNEALYARLLFEHIAEMTPIVYTPVVGTAVERHAHIWRDARGVFLTPAQKDRIEAILTGVSNRDHVEAIVVTDAEAILGIGDQGAGGMAIAVGKLALYTLCGGIRPEATLPVMLDVGTDNQERLDDPVYFGWRHPRIRGQAYDDFLEAFVTAVMKVFPRALLQFEDFGTLNARDLLERYRHRLCTFNDDIQGTGVVTVGSLIAAAQITRTKLSEHDVVILGGGNAGTGIADQIVAKAVDEGVPAEQARSKIWFVGRYGLMLSNMEEPKFPYRKKYYQPVERVKDWKRAAQEEVSLADVIRNVHPSILIGSAARPGAFSEEMIREMAAHVERPIIFALSNPTDKAEAVPADLFRWTGGRVLTATGSPFPDVQYEGHSYRISQCNNSFVFPGVVLGALSSGAKRISNSMLMAAATGLAQCSPAHKDPTAPLLPSLEQVREVSRAVALAVAAQAQREDLAEKTTPEELERKVAAKMWTPCYPRVRLLR
ncbi:MAG: NAD-dependent malic enzyme [Candidatus Binataceae bacterium]